METHLTPHFRHDELHCHHCQACEMDRDFMARLEALRVVYDRPMVLSSAFRCAWYNQQVSSTGPHGPHTTGQAIDVHVFGPDAFELVDLAFAFRFSGIGVQLKGPYASRFVHLDTLRAPDYPRPRLWSY